MGDVRSEERSSHRPPPPGVVRTPVNTILSAPMQEVLMRPCAPHERRREGVRCVSQSALTVIGAGEHRALLAIGAEIVGTVDRHNFGKA